MCVSLMRWGVSPCIWFRRGPWGVAVAPPIWPYTRTWLVSAQLPCGFGAQVGVSYFPVRHSTRIHGDLFVRFPDSCVSLPRISLRVRFLGHLTGRVPGLTYCPPPLFSRTLSFALTSSCDSLFLMHPAIDIVWWCPCDPLQLRCAWWSFVLVGSLTSPPPGRMFEPSCLRRLLCFEAGLTYRPLLAFPGLC